MNYREFIEDQGYRENTNEISILNRHAMWELYNLELVTKYDTNEIQNGFNYMRKLLLRRGIIQDTKWNE